MIKPKKPENIRCTSYEGFEFDLSSSSWRLSRDVKLSLSWVKSCRNARILTTYFKVLAFYAEKYSAHYVSNINSHFRNFVLFTTQSDEELTEIQASHLINYRSSLPLKNEWYLAGMSAFLKGWYDMGWEGVSLEAIQLLSSWRLKGNEKGLAVLTSCPYKGALSDFEYESLHHALTDAFEDNKVSLEDYTLVMLFIAIGRRPSQISDLKIGDLTEFMSSDGQHIFILNVPRRKQRGAKWRELFREVALTPELGVLVKSHIENVKRKVNSIFKKTINTNELAVFPSWIKMRACQNLKISELLEVFADQGLHRRSGSISVAVNKISSGLNIYSERTGQVLEVTPVRLRRTLATRAVREGGGVLVVAELLDHSDTQTAMIYTENVPEHVDAINRAVAEQLIPLAQAFAGVLVDREKDAERGDDLTSRVRSNVSYEGVGSCGSYGFCSALAPIACYTCRHFQPWLDAPHEEILDRLIYQRKEIKSRTGDMTMASVNDRTIFAITEVVRLCAKRKTKQIEA